MLRAPTATASRGNWLESPSRPPDRAATFAVDRIPIWSRRHAEGAARPALHRRTRLSSFLRGTTQHRRHRLLHSHTGELELRCNSNKTPLCIRNTRFGSIT